LLLLFDRAISFTPHPTHPPAYTNACSFEPRFFLQRHSTFTV
jgi:hypothetical protein